MIQSEQLSVDTIMFYVRGPFQKKAAKELSLSVFRSHRLGFTTFHFDLTRASLIDEQGAQHLALIGQGVQDKGGAWKIIGHPPLLKNHLLVDATFEYPQQELWN